MAASEKPTAGRRVVLDRLYGAPYRGEGLEPGGERHSHDTSEHWSKWFQGRVIDVENVDAPSAPSFCLTGSTPRLRWRAFSGQHASRLTLLPCSAHFASDVCLPEGLSQAALARIQPSAWGRDHRGGNYESLWPLIANQLMSLERLTEEEAMRARMETQPPGRLRPQHGEA